jgi:hypothetical protein
MDGCQIGTKCPILLTKCILLVSVMASQSHHGQVSCTLARLSRHVEHWRHLQLPSEVQKLALAGHVIFNGKLLQSGQTCRLQHD